ncbi:hypothetical protein [Sphingomonas alba]|uniref:Uncharacterized protein n=1 Tax=Sphingomonas alba TaxID=2908208 RepID=A0ABT0RIB3_9SPHN|nr:hypothetical protein [Sphingomonas alba]MCL6682368.1 hypothetical protein [Sphingomonas alba]
MAARGGRKPRGAAAIAAVAVCAALLSFQIIRNAAAAEHERYPALAQKLWPSHPAVVTDRVLFDIAVAAAHGRLPPASVIEDARQIATRAPLSPDPFVIRGAIAETQGRGAVSETFLTEARSRDPRSRASRFLLADRYFRTGRMTQGLIEMQVLVGLQSRGLEAFLPALVAYAKTPGAIPQMRDYFRLRPQTEAPVLSILAVDPANADLVMALATNLRRPEPDWRETLLTRLTATGQYAKAYVSWSRLTGVPMRSGLYNAAFAKLPAPAPFNWSYAETPEGVAEADGKGGLDLLYYGRAPATLVHQIMLLRPATYKLAMKVNVDSGDATAIRWAVRCLPGETALAEVPLKPGPVEVIFAVPETCLAARLELAGVAGDVPRTTEVIISGLRLDAEAPR